MNLDGVLLLAFSLAVLMVTIVINAVRRRKLTYEKVESYAIYLLVFGLAIFALYELFIQ